MAQSLPSPPLSRTATPAPLNRDLDTEDQLAVKLDDLLAQYLDILDKYMKLRDEISTQYSEGFLALANAQRTSQMGAGRRYGQDGFDQRMKAIRRVELSREQNPDGSIGETNYRCYKYDYARLSAPSPSTSILDDRGREESDTPQQTQSSEIQENKQTIDAAYRDPAAWFGILVPATLKNTQKHFVQLVDTSMPSLLNTKTRMEALEQEIWDIRTRLGISGEYGKVSNVETERAPNA